MTIQEELQAKIDKLVKAGLVNDNLEVTGEGIKVCLNINGRLKQGYR